ncbi:MAG: VWA domain-containing protein [Saprospirales bacterium]|nr:VWA domain-containing protein [Saprospirales bacterium]MBK6903323.1 VWA domain-containing protein [Saprospirales bacterium]MBK7337254.1 VWA domain-containing protein [Saprospirales bacterium]
MLKSIFGLLSFLVIMPATVENLPSQTEDSKGHHIQVALLLDTSNSMDGLIDQAKSQLWKMVNELATSKKDGESPTIEIALYEYGNDALSGAEGYIRQVTGLTADLDLVSEKLFGLTTNGGSEYCGAVINRAVGQLVWSDSNDDMKIIIVAGNEPFDQGPDPYRDACKTAIGKGIMINTIFCGNYDEGVRTFWKDGADLADGKYFNIDQDQQVIHISTPHDQRILDLNEKLNSTYIGYGDQGEQRVQMQSTQDSNAASYGAANAAERASFKAKESYKNTSWDLVDAMEEDEAVIEKLDKDDLPAEMKDMDKKEQKEYVEAKAKEREEVRKEILELEEKAKEYQAEKRKEMSESGEDTLDKVMSKTIREQAEKKGFKYN